jgi:hypothetical protein
MDKVRKEHKRKPKCRINYRKLERVKFELMDMVMKREQKHVIRKVMNINLEGW